MAPETQFASLDGTAFYGEDSQFQPDPKAIARRSISIFSRRGTETPEPKPPFIAQEAMRQPKQMTERQKSWIKRKSCPASASVPKKPKVTILNAVPPAKTIKMTPLEEEMATSPNEEIISAVSASPTHFTFAEPAQHASSTQHTSPTQRTSSIWSKSAVSLVQRTKSDRRKESNTRIGVWVDGLACWDDKAHKDSPRDEEPSLQEQTGFTPLVSIPITELRASQSRPQLSVVIPSGEPLINDTTLSTILQPMPQRPIVSVAPASIVAKFAFSTPTIPVQEPSNVSPLESSSQTNTLPVVKRKALVRHNVDADTTTPTIVLQRSSRSSSSSSLAEPDDSSEYSQRSSATSVEVVAASKVPEQAEKKTANLTGDAGSPASDARRVVDVNKPLPPSPKPSAGDKCHCTVTPIRPLGSSRSLPALSIVDGACPRTAPYCPDRDDPECPNPSQAPSDDQEEHLSIIADERTKPEVTIHRRSTSSASRSWVSTNDESTGEDEPAVTKSGSVRRSDSVRSVMQPPERAPTLPKRSRKRDWRASRSSRLSIQFPRTKAPRRRRSEPSIKSASVDHADSEPTSILRKCTSAAQLSNEVTIAPMTESLPERVLPPPTRIVIDDGLIVLHGPVTVHEGVEYEGTVSSASAEEVLLNILSALTSTADLFNTALINKGMYRVYKENEMDLIRAVTYNQSPAAWELREWCPPIQFRESKSSAESMELEHTPLSYMRCYRRDIDVIESLKALILERCQTFIRRETAFALSTRTHPHAQRFNDAFWRIWCFCEIFGCRKDREEDVTGQLDWLKGGLLANNQDLTATMNMNLDYEIGSVLLNAPDQFAKGNANGLSAQQLYDMTEIWCCLTTILSGYHWRTGQARQNGVFDDSDMADCDIESPEEALEEWTAYLLTLGPAVVLEMAEFANDPTSTGFALAKANGWTHWVPAESGSTRTTFLKEPVSRLYEERVTATAIRLQNPRERERKEMSRKRVATLAAEIKFSRQLSGYKRLPMIDQSMETPMSALSRQNSTLSTFSFRSHSSVRMANRSSTPAQSASRPPNFSVPRPRSPPSTLWAPRRISPIIEDRVETFNRMSLQNFAGGIAEDTSDLAVNRIMEMGFTAAQAREALRTTDMGDGLRVDRAVDMLLRGQ